MAVLCPPDHESGTLIARTSVFPGLVERTLTRNMYGFLLNMRRGAIANYLDRETARIDALIAAKRAIIERLYEKCEAEIRRAIGQSGLVKPDGATVELRRVFGKHKRAAPPGTPLVTAYRDGQVTLRELRRAERLH